MARDLLIAGLFCVCALQFVIAGAVQRASMRQIFDANAG
jgi:hypothetical protein